MPKIKLDDEIYERARKIAEVAGYSSVDEMVVHMLERELTPQEDEADDQAVLERLKGLGYIS